jgi:thioredoxin reductase
MTTVAIIGAGPYGLSLAAHLGSRDIPYRIFGTPLETWRNHMPAGMLLKSDGFASSLCAPDGQGTLAAYCEEHGIPYDDTGIPVSLEVFTEYALDFQRRFVPHLEDRRVSAVERRGQGFSLTLDDGERVDADYVVCATGITHFASVPDELADLPADLVTHSWAHHDLAPFAGRDVTVLGGGASAIDIATLLHEAGANTSLVARRHQLRFSSPPGTGERSRWQRLRHPSSGMGPGMRSWLFENVPYLFRFLPGKIRLLIISRHLGPAAGWVMKERFEAGVTVTLGAEIKSATTEDGKVSLVIRMADGTRGDVVTDHVVAATGYRPEVGRLEFLSEDLRGALRAHEGMPVVSGSFETSVPGLYVIGPPAVNSFGPLMRFMVGAEYVAPLVAGRLARRVRREQTVQPVAVA